jgi:hypothetical protein
VISQWRYCLDIPNNLMMLEGNVTGVSGAAFQVALTGLHHFGAGAFRWKLTLSWCLAWGHRGGGSPW